MLARPIGQKQPIPCPSFSRSKLASPTSVENRISLTMKRLTLWRYAGVGVKIPALRPPPLIQCRIDQIRLTLRSVSTFATSRTRSITRPQHKLSPMRRKNLTQVSTEIRLTCQVGNEAQGEPDSIIMSSFGALRLRRARKRGLSPPSTFGVSSVQPWLDSKVHAVIVSSGAAIISTLAYRRCASKHRPVTTVCTWHEDF